MMKAIWHNTKYMFLQTIRDRGAIFWMMLYPLLLSLFFYLALGSLDEVELENINIGVSKDYPMKDILQDINILNVSEIEDDDLKTKLDGKMLVAYINKDGDMTIKDNSFSVGIVKSIVDQIKQTTSLGQDARYIDFNANYIKDNSIQISSLKYYMFTLIAMFSVYGYFNSVELFSRYQANIDEFGARVNTTPIKKTTIVISTIIVSLITNLLSNILLLLHLKYVLGLDMLVNLAPSALIIIVANMFSIALGAIIATSNKLSLDAKSGLGISFTLALAFMTGMMNTRVKHAIADNLPLLAKLNPINLVNDALVSVNILNDTKAIYEPLMILSFMTIVLFGLSMLWLRRRRYDSI